MTWIHTPFLAKLSSNKRLKVAEGQEGCSELLDHVFTSTTSQYMKQVAHIITLP